MKARSAIAVLGLCLVSACGGTTDAGRPTVAAGAPDSSYPCGLVDAPEVALVVGAQSGERTTDGAICQWRLDGQSGEVDAVFGWFVNGSLQRESSTDAKLGYSVTAMYVAYHHAITVAPVNNRDACGVDAQTDSGVIDWWVQYRTAGPHADPCAQAKTLTGKSLDLEP